ncbi:MAG: hypothetical protein ABEK50_05165, partial [bacterium]
SGGLKIGPGGHLYFETFEKILSVSDAGKKRWDFSEPEFTNPILSSRGVLITNPQGEIVLLDFDGSVKWRYRNANPVTFSARAVGKHDKFFFGTRNNELMSLSHRGSRGWIKKDVFNLGDYPIDTSSIEEKIIPHHKFLTLAENGDIYTLGQLPITSVANQILGLDKNRSINWKSKLIAGFMAPAIYGNKLFTISFWGSGEEALKLHAFRVEAQKPMNSPWPVFGSDNQNTFRVNTKPGNVKEASEGWLSSLVSWFFQWLAFLRDMFYAVF